MGISDADEDVAETRVTTTAPGVACNRCRKTKLKCSRDRPTCSHCTKSRQQCVYEAKRAKPGVKVGAIESIHHRLEKLEKRALESDSVAANEASNASSTTGAAESVLNLLARELPKLLSASQRESITEKSAESSQQTQSNKRLRLSSPCEPSNGCHRVFTDSPPLPDQSLRHIVVDVYFTHIHPWIPMLHQDRFRAKVDALEWSDDLQLLMHAITLSVSRYLPAEERSQLDSFWGSLKIRRWIMCTAMESVTLEGLQALILVAFDDINNGNAHKAWSLVASLSRTVEFAQLTTEHDNSDPRRPVCMPFSHLPPARDWAELEERRRVFWNVFHLDRLFSITMGWNTSLTSIDVHQRLPCDGILWRRQQEAVLTPYLGIWDKTTGGIGNESRVSYRAGQEAHSTIDSYLWSSQAEVLGSKSPGQAIASGIDMSKVGSFGFCIEAIESMSRVTTYFLQQPVNTSDPKELEAWLSRFKELDLRLVHWKMFLPVKWRAGPALSTAAPNARMDPNLTLAHITHNASTILLHQIIAFPPSHWLFRKRLPSVWSADTCCSAGSEIAKISQKYLESTPPQLPVASPLLTFCLFLAARVMILNWISDEKNVLLDDFWSLKSSLLEISRRWERIETDNTFRTAEDQAWKYARRLEKLYQRVQDGEGCQICVTSYTHEEDRHARPSHTLPPQHSPSYPQQPYNMRGDSILQSPLNPNGEPPFIAADNNNLASGSAFDASIPDPLQLSLDRYGNVQRPTIAGASLESSLDEYFVDMDRVIAFNDGSLFTADWDNNGW